MKTDNKPGAAPLPPAPIKSCRSAQPPQDQLAIGPVKQFAGCSGLHSAWRGVWGVLLWSVVRWLFRWFLGAPTLTYATSVIYRVIWRRSGCGRGACGPFSVCRFFLRGGSSRSRVGRRLKHFQSTRRAWCPIEDKAPRCLVQRHHDAPTFPGTKDPVAKMRGK